MPVPNDYAERVYAGVLGKIIGVYLGRPFEGWTHDRIMARLGEIRQYAHDRLGVPLIVADDDISGTFTFLRALPDHGSRADITPAQIGSAWLNYIVEGRSTLWWGGRGNSTEHTAYLNLLEGVPAPESGSAARNSRVVAEQIGAQIFVDGWAMVAPGDPQLAASLARRAASVSHDGEALNAAAALAAMEAQAFVERDLNRLLDEATRLIPRDSLICRLIADLREWHAGEADWRKTRERVAAVYGYDRYGGNVHVVPNHALIILALLYGGDDFQQSLMIVNTCGWDTDCNSGNVGCLLGIKNGLAGLTAGFDFRTPVADRLFLASADGGRAVTDALTEAYHVVNIGRALAGLEAERPKGGARFHFALPGAVQGFQPENSAETASGTAVENAALPGGGRALALHFRDLAEGRPARAATPVFIPPDERSALLAGGGYGLPASPALYPGQALTAAVAAAAENQGAVQVRLYVRCYGEDDQPALLRGEPVALPPGGRRELSWQVPATDGAPLCEVGVEISGSDCASGTVYLDWLTWSGAPRVTLTRPSQRGVMWLNAWVNALDSDPCRPAGDFYPEPFRLIQNRGRGLFIHGAQDWADYRVSAPLVPHLCRGAGIAARVQGLRRYYGLLLRRDQTLRLVKLLDTEQVLAEAQYAWELGGAYELSLEARGRRLVASVNGQVVFDLEDPDQPLTHGAIALICEEGRVGCERVSVCPLD